MHALQAVKSKLRAVSELRKSDGASSTASERHPRDDVAASPGPPDAGRLDGSAGRPAAGRVRFFIAGDIGQAGPRRSLVADAMARLQDGWAASADLTATFVVCTGDNIYGKADDEAFRVLEREMLSKLPLPWIMTLGNHDVTDNFAGWRWSHRYHGRRGGTGWRWICPAPAFSLDAVDPSLGGPVDLVVVNSNKYYAIKALGPPAPGAYNDVVGGPARPFYMSTGKEWWTEQTRNLEEHLTAGGPPSCDGGRFRVVVGHHPCEHVAEGLFEHRVPLAKYFLATFMFGDSRQKKHRWSPAHVLRRNADLYVCGHQHLMAHMRLRPKPHHPRSREETRCEWVIVGNSAKTEQDDDDFSIPVKLWGKAKGKGSPRDGDSNDEETEMLGSGGSPTTGGDSPRSFPPTPPTGPQGPPTCAKVATSDAADTTPHTSPTAAPPASPPPTECGRFAEKWVSRTLGFAVVDADSAARRLTVSYYTLSDQPCGTAVLSHSFSVPRVEHRDPSTVAIV